MRILHLADLHFGKSLHNLSLLESGDQQYWAQQTLAFIAEQKPDAVVIAGDVYDRSVPSKEAVTLLDAFITGIANLKIPVLMIAGNHDGGDRLQFGAELFQSREVHIAGVAEKEIKCVPVEDKEGNGTVYFWLMPYATQPVIRSVLGKTEEELSDYTQCVKAWLGEQKIDFAARNVLVAHQTVLYDGNAPEASSSETAIGGISGIDISAFEGFDYVALGHFHGAQKIGKDNIRYAGAPLCYHFGEAGQKKGLLMVNLHEKGSPATYDITELTPKMTVLPTIRGKCFDIIEQESNNPTSNCYINVQLQDEWIGPDMDRQIRALFESHGSVVLDVTPDPERKRADGSETVRAGIHDLSLDEHFVNYFRERTQKDPNGNELELIRLLASAIGDQSEKTVDELAADLIETAMRQEEEE